MNTIFPFRRSPPCQEGLTAPRTGSQFRLLEGQSLAYGLRAGCLQSQDANTSCLIKKPPSYIEQSSPSYNIPSSSKVRLHYACSYTWPLKPPTNSELIPYWFNRLPVHKPGTLASPRF